MYKTYENALIYVYLNDIIYLQHRIHYDYSVSIYLNKCSIKEAYLLGINIFGKMFRKDNKYMVNGKLLTYKELKSQKCYFNCEYKLENQDYLVLRIDEQGD